MATVARLAQKRGVRYKAIVKSAGRVLLCKTFSRRGDAKAWGLSMDREVRLHGADDFCRRFTVTRPDLHVPTLKSPAGETGAIYFLFAGPEIVYVGMSACSVQRRIESHMKDKNFDSYAIVHAPESQLRQLEALYIDKLRPAYNRTLDIGRLPT